MKFQKKNMHLKRSLSWLGGLFLLASFSTPKMSFAAPPLRPPTPDFEKLILKKVFQVIPSRKDLAKLHQASTVLLTCIDFRLRDEVEQLMNKHFHMRDDYDEFVIPGASLALTFKEKPHWQETTKDVIGITQKLHGTKRVLFIDHRGCGAYNLAKGKEHASTPAKELETHREVMLQAKAEVLKNFPTMEVHGLLMGLEGKVENLQLTPSQ